ncbi:long chain fatty acid oxidase [Myxozyma melibiosi]|uniref:Long-chain-alcohol oxidase n=1 Tax=Myxozyma melibiosi TaxID=54550 RepID=A0ABR1F483_9ASCO
MTSIPTLTDAQWETLIAAADTFVGEVSADSLIQSLGSHTFSDNPSYESTLRAFAVDRPSTHVDDYKRDVAVRFLFTQTEANLQSLRTLLNLLDYRASSLIFTGHACAFRNLSFKQREAVLLGWSTSRLPPLRMMYRTFYSLSVLPYFKVSGLAAPAMRFPLRNPDADDHERYASKTFYRYKMITQAELLRSTFDVVIIGSGSGASVSATRIAQAGYSVLVLEKGRYYHQDELNMTMDEASAALYENKGLFESEGRNITCLAGSTFGGGSTVNWSASLKPSAKARHEWAVQHGAKFYATREYDRALTSVCEFMGVSDKHIVHSRANQIILSGSEKIGSPAHAVPQNTGGHTHRCGFCGAGCRFGEKQGGVARWFVEAAKHGAKFLDQALVRKIRTKDGRAIGVDITAYGFHELFVPAKLVVCAAGSMNTPVVLQKSGFTNKNIGRHLHIHPVVFTYGVWKDIEFNAHGEAILTAVNTEVDDLDGQGYGAKVECLIHQPSLMFAGMPWRGADDYKKTLAKFNNIATFISIARDRGEGEVYYDAKTGTQGFRYQVNEFDRHSIAEGIIKIAEICLAESVNEIHAAETRIPPFIATAEDHEQGRLSPRFQAWCETVRRYAGTPFSSIIGTAHQMSTCRMGSSPVTSATKTTGELWECKDLFVTDASVLPSASGVNPMITVMSTAEIIAGNIVKRLAELKQTGAAELDVPSKL